MRNNNNNKKSGQSSAFFEFFNIKVVLGLLAFIFGITFYFQWRKKQKENQEANNPANQNAEADAVKPKTTSQALWDSIKNDTQLIAHHLGVNYSWFNPQSWTENDKEVERLLCRQVNNLKHVETLYYQTYAKGRNLKADVIKLLDASNLENVRNFYKKYNKTF